MARYNHVTCITMVLLLISCQLHYDEAKSVKTSQLVDELAQLTDPVPVYCGRSELFDEEHHNIYGSEPLEAVKRVVGGSISQRGEWPWLVSIQATTQFSSKSAHLCGGSLINDQWFLTATHCFELTETYPGLQINYTARVGEHHFQDDEDSQEEVEIEKIIFYPGRTRANFDYDLTLVKLAKKVRFNRHVNTICLPEANDELPSGTRMLTAGWGNTAEGGRGSDVVKHLSIPIIDHDTCGVIYSNVTSERAAEKVVCDQTNEKPIRKHRRTRGDESSKNEDNSNCRTVLFNETISENVTIMDDMLCAGWMEGGHGNCQGDSGGPLVYYNRDIRGWVLTGVVSFTNGCARAGYPAVYVKVSKYIPWIEKTIAENIRIKKNNKFNH